MPEPDGACTTGKCALSPTQAYLLAGLFALLALVSLGRWWASGRGEADPRLTDAPKALEYPPDPFRSATASKAP